MAASTIGILALVGAAGAASQWIAWRVKLPSILLLLFSGILLGPVLGWLRPDDLLGDVLFPFVSIAVAIILFEGGLTLERSEIRGHGKVLRNLLTFGVLVTWVSIAVTVHFLFDVSLAVAFLFSSIGVVTGPTVIKPLLRIVRPGHKISQVLHWEGILVDPVGAMLAILVFEYIVEVEAGGGVLDVMLVLLSLVAIGLIFGAAFASVLVWLLRNRHIPDFLVESSTLLTVIAAFAVSEYFQHEAGLITVTVMGIWLANSKGIRLQEILHFKENLSVLLISALFVLLAARLEIAAIVSLGLSAFVFLLVIQFVIRPLSVYVCTIGAGWSWQERALLSWIAPRGIVAAAISSLFLLRLESAGIEGAELLVPLAFVMIIGTVVFQSLTTKAVASRLGVRNPEPNGVLIVGANHVAQQIGLSLKSAGVRVILVDRSAQHVKEARQNGLKTFYGHVTSAHAENHLDLTGIGRVIAVSRNQDLNSLAALHFRNEFGIANIYLVNQSAEAADEPGEVSGDLVAFQFLFSPEHTYQHLSNSLRAGARIGLFEVGEDDSGQLASALLPNAQYLFAINTDGRTFVYTADDAPSIDVGWKLLYLSERSDPE